MKLMGEDEGGRKKSLNIHLFLKFKPRTQVNKNYSVLYLEQKKTPHQTQAAYWAFPRNIYNWIGM